MTDLDFAGLNHQLLFQGESLLLSWLPGGKRLSGEFVCGSTSGEAGESLKVNLKTGKWSDFATGQKGGDLISLYAEIHRVSQGIAFKELSKTLGGVFDKSAPHEKPKKEIVDIIPPPTTVGAPKMESKWGAPTSSWCYRDKDGRVLFYVARYDTEDGKKQFLPWSYSKLQKKWVQKGWPAPRPLFGLDFLSAKPESPVLIVEGEKACEAARSLCGDRYVVVTWPNGSNAVHRSDWTSLYGRKILVWPDADPAGIKAADEIAEILHKKCPEVRVIAVEPAGGEDAADWVKKNGTSWKSFVAWVKPLVKAFGNEEGEEIKVDVEELKKISGPSSRGFQLDAKQEWLRDATELGELKIFYNGAVEWLGSKNLGLTYVINDLYLTSRQQNVKCGKELINAFIQNKIVFEQQKYFDAIVDDLFRVKTEPKGEVEAFVSSLINDPTAEDFAVMKHFLWQIKRKALGLEVSDHMMPVIIGASHAGKSVAIKKLLQPLQELHTDSTLDICSDERQYALFHRHLVVSFDEMAKSEKTNVAALKRLITNDVLSYRILATNLHQTSLNRATFIGSSNNSVESLIQDPTSVRRFYEYVSRDQCDWGTINSIDYVNLWRSAAFEGESPYVPYKARIRAIQEGFRFKTDFQRCLEEAEFQKSDSPQMLLETLHRDVYKPYCERQGIKFVKSTLALGQELKEMGVRTVQLSGGIHRKKRAIYGFCLGFSLLP